MTPGAHERRIVSQGVSPWIVLLPEVLAAVVAAEIIEAHSPDISNALREPLADRIEAALRRIARQEREACVALCLERQAMWEATEARSTIAARAARRGAQPVQRGRGHRRRAPRRAAPRGRRVT